MQSVQLLSEIWPDISSIKFEDTDNVSFSATIMEYQVSSAWPIPLPLCLYVVFL